MIFLLKTKLKFIIDLNFMKYIYLSIYIKSIYNMNAITYKIIKSYVFKIKLYDNNNIKGKEKSNFLLNNY